MVKNATLQNKIESIDNDTVNKIVDGTHFSAYSIIAMILNTDKKNKGIIHKFMVLNDMYALVISMIRYVYDRIE